MIKILIADDDRVTRRVLEVMLGEWGYETIVVRDGVTAWEALQHGDGPRLALLDWLMPGLDGLEICRRIRALPTRLPPYLILLTVRDSRQDVVTGLEGGADDYIVKPFDQAELHARLQTGMRILRLQRDLAKQLETSEQALALVKKLQGLLPICSYCKKIRDDQNYWRKVEDFIAEHSEARFSHGICPSCWESSVLPQLRQATGEMQAQAGRPA
ncbi:MAG TPA: response regulator transcription factor [Gemmataceae bacterium]|nr:response regulator transcription factor [Gemmataceae bacterium]